MGYQNATSFSRFGDVFLFFLAAVIHFGFNFSRVFLVLIFTVESVTQVVRTHILMRQALQLATCSQLRGI